MARPESGAVVLTLPFRGSWLTQNSPARRVPSHGSELFGERYAIDFVPVDERDRTATRRDWRTVVSTEPPDRFVGFGRPILAPAAGRVVVSHDGEPDHEARRSPFALLGYAATQGRRVSQGIAAVAGNHVIIRLEPESAGGPDREVFVALVHLKCGSVRVRPGDVVAAAQQVGACGNSGNSTQPHLHVQAMTSAELSVAVGLPMVFRRFRERPPGSRSYVERMNGVPGERRIVEQVPDR